MTTIEITKQQREIENLLAERRLKEVFAKLSVWVEELQEWQSRDKLTEMETSYRYMIQYMLDGVDDPERKRIYDHLVLSAYGLADRLSDSLMAVSSPTQYYSWRRYAVSKRTNSTLASQLAQCDDALNELSLASLLNDVEADTERVKAMKQRAEEATGLLFMDVWTNYPATGEDYATLCEVFTPGHYSDAFVSLVVSALLLNLMHRFDEEKLLILLEGYRHDAPEVQLRSLCAVLIVMYLYRERLALLPKVQNRVDALVEEPQFKNDVRTVFLQFIKSRETEKISRKMNEELLPEMMKLAPSLYKKMKQEDLMNDINAMEENPEWQDMLDKSGVADKLKELSDLQMEGADVFMSTFSHLKNFPFFQSIQNWFLPFAPDHTALGGILSGNEGNMFKQMILSSVMLCNSDKYSFCLSLNQVPEAQRSMMMGQFNAENSAMKEMVNEELMKRDLSRENISNRYIQDLYRFFKLYNRHQEFTDPFAGSINLLRVPAIDTLLGDNDSLQLIGEYYFSRGYYDEALELFERLSQEYHSKSEIYQKIGFCYQKQGEYAEALEAFLKAEMVAPNSFWTIRRIATCYRHLKKPEKALAYYQQAERMQPENLSVQMNIGHCFVEQKDYDEALKYYFKVDYLDPKGEKAWRPIAWCSFLTGKQEQALRYYEKILATRPTALDYMNTGHTLLALKQVRKAVDAYRQSIKLEGGNTTKFLIDFKQDVADLVAAGVAPSDIPILLDQLMYEANEKE